MRRLCARLNLWRGIWLCTLFLCPACIADTQYQTAEAFLLETIPQAQIQKPAVIWLDKNLQTQIAAVLGHPYPQARLRYWREGSASVWVLDEIGKEYPITAGFWVNNGKIARAQVLTYRETRGAEIHLPNFLKQFVGSQLRGDTLSSAVDGIAGATLSVNAMTNMAKLALLLDHSIQNAQGPQP